MENYEYKNLLSEDITDTIEFEITPTYQTKKKNITFVENDVENGIIILNTSTCCFYKHSHNIPHDHLSISRGIQCGNGLSAVGNPFKINSDYSNNPQTRCRSPYRHYQYPKNATVNQDFVKPPVVIEYPILNKWENIPKCPSLRESEKFRYSQDEFIINKSFTFENNNLACSGNDKPVILKSIMKTNSILDPVHDRNNIENDSNFDRTNRNNNDHLSKYNSLCSELKDVFVDDFSQSEHIELINEYEDVDSNSIIKSYGTINSEVSNNTEKNDFTIIPIDKDTAIVKEAISDSSNTLECQEREETIKTDDISMKDVNEENNRVPQPSPPKCQNAFIKKNKSRYLDHNNSNFHNEYFSKSKHTSYFTESVNSRNIVRAKYCSEKSVKHKFFLSENANIELVLQDPSDRRIKSVCDKFNCDIDVYSKVIKSGYLKNIVVIAAPNYDCLRKCVRSLDSYMNWCLTCQLTS